MRQRRCSRLLAERAARLDMAVRRQAQAENSKGPGLMVAARLRRLEASWLLALSIFCFLQGGRVGAAQTAVRSGRTRSDSGPQTSTLPVACLRARPRLLRGAARVSALRVRV